MKPVPGLLLVAAIVALPHDLAHSNVTPRKPPDRPPLTYFTNSIGMKFTWIPLGAFMMGSPKDEIGRTNADDAETHHLVRLTKGFYLGVYPVTQEQWKAITGDNPSHFKGEANLPVENVSWNTCQEFLSKLTQRDGLPYRMPTEAEWEYACRAGTMTPFHFGDTISTDQANYDGNYAYGTGKKGVYREKTTPVGQFPPNLWGLHDMHGNVWQMCQDWYGAYPNKEVVDPQGPDAGRHRTIRGGSWMTYPDYCRSAYRRQADPGESWKYYGLRVCLCQE